MGFFTEDIQRTSVSLYIERLSNLEEIDWYLLQQLTESIQMQANGAREAIETVRKKLKHGGTQQKLRVLEILKLLMENSNQQFHRQFIANEKLRERFELMLTSPGENTAVKRELVSLLGAWSVKYKNEPGMRGLQDLYDLGRGGGARRVNTRPRANTDTMNNRPAQPQSPVTPTYRQPEEPVSSPPTRYRSPSPTREERRRSMPPPAQPSRPVQVEQPKPKSKPRSQSSAASTTRPTAASGSNGPTRVFNFEKAKPKILEEIAIANNNSNNLVNALKLINTSEDRWEIELQHDKRLQEYHDKCEESKKKIVRYARLVEDEDWIGTLLATNEGLLKALEMYDIMLAGEIPAAWLLAQQNQQNLQAALAYREPPKTIRAPPPPPPIQTSRQQPLQIEDSFSNMQIARRDEPEEELDPFADPVTPIEEEGRRDYVY